MCRRPNEQGASGILQLENSESFKEGWQLNQRMRDLQFVKKIHKTQCLMCITHYDVLANSDVEHQRDFRYIIQGIDEVLAI